MKIFRRTRKERVDALHEIVLLVVKTSLSSFPEQRFCVFGLTGPETAHNVFVQHEKISPYTLTTVTVERKDRKEHPVTVKFYWNGVHFPRPYEKAVYSTFEHFFPEEGK